MRPSNNNRSRRALGLHIHGWTNEPAKQVTTYPHSMLRSALDRSVYAQYFVSLLFFLTPNVHPPKLDPGSAISGCQWSQPVEEQSSPCSRDTRLFHYYCRVIGRSTTSVCFFFWLAAYSYLFDHHHYRVSFRNHHCYFPNNQQIGKRWLDLGVGSNHVPSTMIVPWYTIRYCIWQSGYYCHVSFFSFFPPRSLPFHPYLVSFTIPHYCSCTCFCSYLLLLLCTLHSVHWQ